MIGRMIGEVRYNNPLDNDPTRASEVDESFSKVGSVV